MSVAAAPTPWEVVEVCNTMEECKDFVRGGGLKDEKGTSLKFKWNRAAPGDGVSIASFCCISHKDCPVVARCKFIGGVGKVEMQPEVKHSTTVATKERKNSDFTAAQRETLRLCVDAGTKPAGMLATLTNNELKRCKAEGVQPKKRPTGGLAGVLHEKETKIRDEIRIHKNIVRIYL